MTMVSRRPAATIIYFLGALCLIVEAAENAVSGGQNAWFQSLVVNPFFQPLQATGVNNVANQNPVGGNALSFSQSSAWTSTGSGPNYENGNVVYSSQPSISFSSDGAETNPFQNQWTPVEPPFTVNSFPFSTILAASYPPLSDELPIPTVKRIFGDSIRKYANGLNITIPSIPIIVETANVCIVTPISPATVHRTVEGVVCLFSRVVLRLQEQICAEDIQIFNYYVSRALSTYQCTDAESCLEAFYFGSFDYLISQGITGETNFITIAAMINRILSTYPNLLRNAN